MVRAFLLLPLACLGVQAFFPSAATRSINKQVAAKESGRASNIVRNAEETGFNLGSVFSSGSAADGGDFFAGLTSWWESLFNPGAAKTSTSSTSPTPKRRTGGPVALVFGATGKTGREVVESLLGQGFDVVAAVRNSTKASEVFASRMGWPSKGNGVLDVRSGVDVTDSSTLTPALFQDVKHVVLALGPVGGPQPGGGFGFYPGLTSEDVDYKGVVNVVEAFEKAYKSPSSSAETKPMFRFESASDLSQWERLDDVIMGGRSSSGFELGEGFAEYKGLLVVEDGGFCGTRASDVRMDLTGFDGIRLRVKGDGNRYKLNLKTVDNTANENVYQVAFDTVDGAWTVVELPFELFLPVVRNRVNYKAPRLSARSKSIVAASVGLVYSRFEFNRQPNPRYRPGPFSLKISDISAYRQPRPAVVMVSSAGSERNAKVETEEERRAEIPIVQLNPGGILNWKYKAEAALRASRLPYTIFRACGLVPDRAFNKTYMLQAAQGDVITGRLTRGDLAQAVAGALTSPYAAFKTLEIRRDENDDAANKATDFDRMYRGLVLDSDRVTSGLLPFPEPVDPPGDVSAERRQEILNDPRVQATIERDRQVANAAADDQQQQPQRAPAAAGAA